MELNVRKPKKALSENKAFLRMQPDRAHVEKFKENLSNLITQLKKNEHEEHHKNDVSDFLKNTFYNPEFYINTYDRTDLVIHRGKAATEPVSVMIEVKKPTNKSEMVTVENINAKAFQELILYYLRERITKKNQDIKHLIITNNYEWFIFDAHVFENLFAKNKTFVKKFEDFERGGLSGKDTDYFYREVAKPFIEEINQIIAFVHFDIRDYEKYLEADNDKGLTKLLALFKIFSPQYLLKLPFENDSNTLDNPFYNELLHIIGLEETKQGSKKVIGRCSEATRNQGSLLENTITQVDSHDKIQRMPNALSFGDTHQDRLFSVSLELVITWINRILFLKLLEGQLVSYHKGDSAYKFFSLDNIKNFDDLNSLFFQVLAKVSNERPELERAKFSVVPYLNSSLFEPTELEHTASFISNLRDEQTVPIHKATILKSDNGKKRTGELTIFDYLVSFLNAYDFGANECDGIKEDSRSIINASVLGLIFEKINGYKDGSFFTPGFITMYMCRETIRKAVVQKFNDVKGWNCKDLAEIEDKLERSDRQEANSIINSLKICDPAVGSGHFLVSALNEIIAIKNDLNVLQDKNGARLKHYSVSVENDELLVVDSEDGELFSYNPKSKESQRIQETLFHEKQTIIENCLFGVDINPNSVKICRLRLWIELLKNAYYKTESELETLPNIDINIKCGNSLISRFGTDTDIKQALKKSKWTITSYRNAVDTYRNAQSKEQKHEMESLINDIKSNFRSEISLNDPKVLRLKKRKGEILSINIQPQMFEMSKKEKSAQTKKLKGLTDEVKKLEGVIKEVNNNKIYEDAFEWRIEFPEVLSDDGEFLGFDVIVGNPPYVQLSKTDDITESYKNHLLTTYETSGGRLNTFIFFIHLSNKILHPKGVLNFIIPNTILSQEYYSFTRDFLINKVELTEIVNFPILPFEDAVVETVLIQFFNSKQSNATVSIKELSKESIKPVSQLSKEVINRDNKFSFVYTLNPIIEKVFSKEHLTFGSICAINQGIALKGDKSLSLKDNKENENCFKLLDGKNINKYSINWDGVYIDYDLDKIHSCKRKDIFESSEKLMFRRVSSTLIFTYDDSKHFALNTLVIVNKIDSSKGPSLKFILGLMNSKLLNYVYSNKFKSTKKVFSEIQARSIKELPIPVISLDIENEISNISMQIIELKKASNETNDLETQIDALVYKIFNITEEEIKIIEKS